MDSLPEDIQLKIYKDVHGMAYSSVLNGIHKVGHKNKYSNVLNEVVFKKIQRLLEYGMPGNIDEDTIRGRLNIRMTHMLMEINDYMDMYEVHGDYDPDNELKNQINDIQSYDLYDISFDDALENAIDEIEQQQAEEENDDSEDEYGPWTPAMAALSKRIEQLGRIVEAEHEAMPPRTGGFGRYTPSANEDEMEELHYQLEVMNEHRMYTYMGCC